jgi:hypothetical protein
MRSNNKYRVVGLLIGCLLLSGWVNAQRKKQDQQQGLKMIARPWRDSVQLRWAPASVMLWKAANESGYILKRYTIVRKGKVLSIPEEVTLHTQPLKPLPLKDWEQVLKVNEKYGAVAAQALYGESFVVDADPAKGANKITEIYHKSRELESRYSFTLFSADQSFYVATATGLAFTDKHVHPDEKYLYRLYLAANPSKVKTDTGYVYTGFSDASPVPAPTDLQAQAMPRSVLLSWNKTLVEHLFTAFIVERSNDEGRTFSPVSDEPVVNTQTTTQEKESQRFFRIDSVQQSEKLLVYRLRGITPFGEVSPPSDTVQVIVHEVLDARPAITGTTILDNGQVKIDWIMPPGKALVTGFDIERAQSVNKKYTKINKTILQAGAHSFTDISPKPSNYYRVKVITKDGQSAVSLPYFVQLEDSIPPAAPVGLKGVIDYKGGVRLVWDANKEEDIYAYRVFRANDLREEFVQVSKAPVVGQGFQDTITLQTLTKNVYYKIVALDGHYNPSEFSEVLVLKRPDIIPPVPPVFIDMTADAAGVHLKWQPSTSTDVVKHELLRTKDTTWEVLLTITGTDSTALFTDTTGIPGTEYQYIVVAEDDSQLRSPSKPVSGRRINLGLPPGGKNLLKAAIDRENKSILLKWQQIPNLKLVWIYRSVMDQPYRLYKTMQQGEKEFIDTELFINQVYKYKLKVIKTDGAGFFTDEVTVHY